jgi:hypothetical protein
MDASHAPPVLTERKIPGLPIYVLVNHSAFPSEETNGRESLNTVLTASTFTGSDHEPSPRVVTQMSRSPLPPARAEWK